MPSKEDRVIISLLKDTNLRLMRFIREKMIAGNDLTAEEGRLLAVANQAIIQMLRLESDIAAREGPSYSLDDLGITEDDLRFLSALARQATDAREDSALQ